MRENKGSVFLVGFVIGTLLVLLGWYWYKSTSAEDGALDLLARFAEAQARLRELETANQPGGFATSSLAGSPASRTQDVSLAGDDLQAITGIGPTYARRLREHGIETYAQLAELSPDKAREMVGLSMKRTAEAAEWIDEARRLAAA